MAVWRELRRAGAMAMGGGTWIMPASPIAEETLTKVRSLVERAQGEVLVLRTGSVDGMTDGRLQELYTDNVEAEWIEFLSDCEKYLTEVAHEIETAKFTLAELEEEEQSFERLRRWHRGLSLRDRFGAPSATTSTGKLGECSAAVEHFAEQVYVALGQGGA